MKKVILTVFVVFAIFINARAQEFKTEKDLVESVLGKVKKDFVKETLLIPEDKNNEFWKVYNKYEEDKKELAAQRFKLANNYALLQNVSYQKLDKDFMKKVFKLQRKSDRNIRKYYRKIDRKVSTETAMQFFQVEQYLRTGIDNLLYGNLPLKEHVL